jgi:hypothetical protein
LTVVIATAISVCSLLISAALFFINYQSLREVKRQNTNIRNAMKGDIIEVINKAHRELFSQIISDDNYAALFHFPEEKDLDETKRNYIATFFINNTFTSFYYYQQGLINEAYWNGYQNDIADTFQLPFIEKRWNEVKRFHDINFQNFIDNLISRGIRYTNAHS